ncbi:hypothetical protein [Merismopedia glauca]|uniref:Uncharacterized protein n=1 Tax=Merismopedia glauca CCAP 1448/3 TaxID=1296344 RepID=A0A2T1C1Z6_9CYAN|nr:hypothetical protein [Merismopedia glauca]PSB02300.1 hypothetical protein C7B64_13770 [Merismopedia glauca CCAP 1448/3]
MFNYASSGIIGQVRSQVEADHHGRIVAINIESGAFEVGDDSLSAAKQLLAHCPDAQIFGIRIGYGAVHRFGFGATAPVLSDYAVSRAGIYEEHP